MDHFLGLYFRRRDRAVPAIAPEVTSAFVRYGWPGNVRKLEKACERIAQTCACPMVGQACVSMPGVSERDVCRSPPPVGVGVADRPLSRARQLHARARSPTDRAAPPPPGPVLA